MMTDLDYIRMTLDLAAQGKSLVSPNPLVGSVIVKDDAIVGRGYHRYQQLKHAEVWALDEAGPQARDATVYVNLEPCSHDGAGKRTPPCVKALIEARVKRVVASLVDPNPRVNGRGFDQLREAGIDITVGVLEEEARKLNEKYLKFVTTGIPFVHLKVASSLDGRIATRTGESKWITNQHSREAGQGLRHEYDAILVGIGTVLADDPNLTDRTGRPRRNPLVRGVLDDALQIPLTSRLVATAAEVPVIVFTARPDSAQADWDNRRRELVRRGVTVVEVASDHERLHLGEVLERLAAHHVTSVLVEGGGAVTASFLEQGLVDKITFFIAPMIIGGLRAIPAIGGSGVERLADACRLTRLEVRQRADDLEITGYPRFPGKR